MLKPCPHCGGTDIQHRGTPGHNSVQCACFRGGFETPGGAEECWNRRATRPDGGDSLREALELELTHIDALVAELDMGTSKGMILYDIGQNIRAALAAKDGD